MLGKPLWTDRNYAAALHDTLDDVIRSPHESGRLLEVVRGFDATLRKRSTKAWFLLSLTASARKASRERRQRGKLRSLWGTTPIINIAAAAQADRILGIEAETVVHTTYQVTQKFDLNFGRARAHVEKADANLLDAFHWVVFAWSLLRFDIFHYFNDRGILLPAGGYGSRFGINLDE